MGGVNSAFKVMVAAGLLGLVWPQPASAGDIDRAIDLLLKQHAAETKQQRLIDATRAEAEAARARGCEHRARRILVDEASRRLATRLEAQQRQIAMLRANGTDAGAVVRAELERFVAGLQAQLPTGGPEAALEARRAELAALRAMITAPAPSTDVLAAVLGAYADALRRAREVEVVSGADPAGRAVHFVRVGRIGWVFVTEDGASAGIWDSGKQAFAPLTGDMATAVRRAVDVVRAKAPAPVEIPLWAATREATR